EQTENIINNGIDKELFSRVKKSTYGSLIRQMNNVQAVANLMINNHMDGIGPYDILDSLSEITPDDVYNFIRSELLTDKLVLSVIERIDD
ncbi:MAG: insulinase family protein, partial [Ruminococcus sp.]|nr:insulinase family protein [Ruminococcus sp.]